MQTKTAFAADPEVKRQLMEQVQIPDIYYTPDTKEPKSTTEKLKKVDIMELVVPWLEHPVLMALSATGLCVTSNALTNSFEGEYSKSLLGRTGALGDRIIDSKFVQSKPIQATLGGIKKGIDATHKFLMKSDIYRAIMTTPTSPEWQMPKHELLSFEERAVDDFKSLIDGLYLTVPECEGLESIGLTKAEKSYIKNHYNKKWTKLSETEITDAVNRIKLKRLNLPEARFNEIINDPNATLLVKQEIADLLGLDADQIFKKDFSIKQVKEAVKRGRGKVWVSEGEIGMLGDFQPLRRTISCDGIFNRYNSLGEGVKSRLGKGMNKFLLTAHRGLTFGGGAGAVMLFVSPFIVRAILDTKKADPDKKIGTAGHGLVDAISWAFTFPLALKIFHAFGGMRYAGMTKEDVAEYKKVISDFNERASFYKKVGRNKIKNENVFNQQEYDKALKIAKEQLETISKRNVKDQTFLTKVFKKIGKFLTFDLGNFKGFQNGKFWHDLFSNTKQFFKDCGGVPMRFIMFFAISMSVLEPIVSKMCDIVFGKHFDGMKEEEHEAGKKAQKEFTKKDLEQRLLEAQQEKVSGIPANQDNEFIIPEDLIIEPQQTERKPKKLAFVENNENNTNPFIETPPAEAPISETTKTEKVTPEVSIEETKPTEKVETIPPVQEIKESQRKEETSKHMGSSKNDSYTYIPSSECTIKVPDKEFKENKYIPSQRAAKFEKTFDNSGLSSALKRADRAEQKALEVLADR